MSRNGITFASIVQSDQIISGVWDPYFYKNKDSKNRLEKFVEINKSFEFRFPLSTFDYSPIEYRDIPRGNHITFNLSKNFESQSTRFSAVPENTLLLGTMRAYLGNIIVTPKSDWISGKNLWFPINSEFCEIIPFDNLKYFWLGYLKSSLFLNNLPTGTGGTRPRVSSEQLFRIPVIVPDLNERTRINSSLESLAKKLWSAQSDLSKTIDSNF